MKLMTFNRPDMIYIEDTIEHSMVAFTTHGKSWWYIITENMWVRAYINFLELLTQVEYIWMDIIDCDTSPQCWLLYMGDISYDMGWLRRTNFRSRDESDTYWKVKQRVVRKIANYVLDTETVLYILWFREKYNTATYSFPQYFYLVYPQTHTKLLPLSIPQHLPHSFNIINLLNKIWFFVSFVPTQLPENTKMVEITKYKRLSTWKNWITFLVQIWFHQYILINGLTSFQQNIIFPTFYQAIIEGYFSGRYTVELVEGTVNVSISHVVLTFYKNVWPDPRMEFDSRTRLLPPKQLWYYRNQDS